MTWGNYDSSKNYLKAKLENFGKGNDTPFFNILKWNGVENESVGQGAFVEGTLKHIEVRDTQYGPYATLEMEDGENNSIKWGMKLGRTMRNILFKLYAAASNDIKIKNINLKTGVYNDKKFVSILIDGMKYDNPFSKRNEALAKFDTSEEITSRIREVKDPETGEVVKRDETKLDERVISTIIPTINDALNKDGDDFWSKGTETKVDGTPVEDEDINLPF